MSDTERPTTAEECYDACAGDGACPFVAGRLCIDVDPCPGEPVTDRAPTRPMSAEDVAALPQCIPPADALVRPEGVTCPTCGAAAKSRVCRHYRKNGGCAAVSCPRVPIYDAEGRCREYRALPWDRPAAEPVRSGRTPTRTRDEPLCLTCCRRDDCMPGYDDETLWWGAPEHVPSARTGCPTYNVPSGEKPPGKPADDGVPPSRATGERIREALAGEAPKGRRPKILSEILTDGLRERGYSVEEILHVCRYIAVVGDDYRCCPARRETCVWPSEVRAGAIHPSWREDDSCDS